MAVCFPALRSGVVVVALGLVLSAAPASAQFGYTGSTHFVTVETPEGDRTEAAYIFTTLDYEAGPLRTSLTVPLVAQSLEWTDPTVGRVATGWQTGMADPTIRLDARVWAAPSSTVRLTGSVKLPVTSTEDGRSTGEVDAAVGVTVTTSRGRHSVMADVTYWMLGDPDAVTYRNVPAIYVGYARVLDRQYRWSGIVSISAAPSAIPTLGAPAQLSAALLRVVGRRAALGVSVDVGLTDQAADLAVGALWRIVF